MEVSS